MTKPITEVIAGLVEGFYPQYGAPGSRDVDVSARRKIVDEGIALVMDHVREMESLRIHLNQVIAEEGAKAVRAEAELALRDAKAGEAFAYVNKFSGALLYPEQQPDAATDSTVYAPLYAAVKLVSGSKESNGRQSNIQLPQSELAYINGVGMRVLPYNSTLAAIERAGYTATEAPL